MVGSLKTVTKLICKEESNMNQQEIAGGLSSTQETL